MSAKGAAGAQAGVASASARARRGVILDAAESVFARAGYHDATVAAITEAAGIGLGTFYLYFPSKQAVFRELLVTRRNEVTARLDESVARTRRGELPLRDLIRTFVAVLVERRDALRLLREAFLETRLRADFYGALVDRLRLVSAYATGPGAAVRLDSEVLAWSVVGAIEFVVLRWTVWEGSAVIPDATVEGVIHILMRVFDPDAGHADTASLR